jgi:hypothetical protein
VGVDEPLELSLPVDVPLPAVVSLAPLVVGAAAGGTVVVSDALVVVSGVVVAGAADVGTGAYEVPGAG